MTKTGHRTIGGWLAALVAAAMALVASGSAMAQGGQVVGWGSDLTGNISGGATALLPWSGVAGGEAQTLAIRADGTVDVFGYVPYYLEPPSTLRSAVSVSMGQVHALAIKSDGTLSCWGINSHGQSVPPADIGPVAQIACGDYHTVALTASGVVRCWGAGSTTPWGDYPEHGQSIVPELGASAIHIGAAYAHTMAVLADGTVRCWGLNDHGQCNVPADLGPALQAVGGMHFTLALRADRTVRGWGWNSFGQLSPPPDLGNVTQIAAGYYHSMALKADGTVVCFGMNTHPNFPTTTYGQSTTPAGLQGVAEIAAGACHSIARRSDGTIVAWGLNSAGQCSIPKGRGAFTRISMGAQHAAATRIDGALICWGLNNMGQCQVPATLGPVAQVSAGAFHTVAVKSTGQVVCWGDNSSLQCNVPNGLGTVVSIAAGGGHTAAASSTGVVRCWGGISLVPTGLAGVVQVAAGNFIVAARKSNGTVVAWPAGYESTAVPAGLSGVAQVSIAAQADHVVARKSDGSVICWGTNTSGQCNTPAGLSGVIDVAGGMFHTAALKSDGSVVCWGSNAFGECTPPAGLQGVTRISAGNNCTIAILSASQSNCSNPAGSGTATPAINASSWQDVATWSWSAGGGPQVPGALTNVTLGEYGSVGSLCDARCATLDVPASSTLLVPVDLTQPSAAQDHSIDVGGLARLQGRVWLLATGASALPADFSVPVVNAGSYDGLFSIIQSTLPAPSGKFTTLVPTAGLAGGGSTWTLALRDLPSSFASGAGGAAGVAGGVVAAEAMDLDGDGFDDLALAIDNGPSQPGLLQVILNDGEGNLSDTTYLVQTSSRPVAVAVGDVDGDGDDDAVVATSSNLSARVYLNTLADAFAPGGKPLSPSTVLAVGALPTCLAVAPWPQPRVAVGTAEGSVAVFDPAVQQALQSVSVPMAPAAMSVRGRIIVSGGANPSSIDGLLPSAPGRLVVLSPAVDGSYALSQTVDVPGRPRNLDVADIDRDGTADAITANLDPQQVATGTPLAVLTLFKGTAAGFGQAVPIAPQGATAGGDVAIVDVNADGVRDLVSVHQTLVGQSAAVAILVSQSEPGGPLTLGRQDTIAASHPVLCPKGDVLGAQAEGVFVVDLGTGESLVEAPRAIPYRPEVPPAPPCVADLDGDSDVDGLDLAMLLNDWGPATGTTAADLDHDGRVNGLDLATLLAHWGACPP